MEAKAKPMEVIESIQTLVVWEWEVDKTAMSVSHGNQAQSDEILWVVHGSCRNQAEEQAHNSSHNHRMLAFQSEGASSARNSSLCLWIYRLFFR